MHKKIFPEFQLLLLIARGCKGGQKTPMKIQICPILIKFKPYILHSMVAQISFGIPPKSIRTQLEVLVQALKKVLKHSRIIRIKSDNKRKIGKWR